MLDELQLDLYGNSLLRLVDFGHEFGRKFGHIVESLALYELLHNECISIGMLISSHPAYIISRLSLTGLEEILNCSSSLGLPVYAAHHDCYSSQTL